VYIRCWQGTPGGEVALRGGGAALEIFLAMSRPGVFAPLMTAIPSGATSTRRSLRPFEPTAILLRGEAFRDHFVIPLAQKIDDRGIFVPAGDQELEYGMTPIRVTTTRQRRP
jgi:hypothetical protein